MTTIRTQTRGRLCKTGARFGTRRAAVQSTALAPVDCTTTLTALVGRIEQAMRPLDKHGYGPDHDRVQHLYMNLVRTSTDDPLEQARRAVLYEMLYPVLCRHGMPQRLSYSRRFLWRKHNRQRLCLWWPLMRQQRAVSSL